jgi:hypothetical protein
MSVLLGEVPASKSLVPAGMHRRIGRVVHRLDSVRALLACRFSILVTSDSQDDRIERISMIAV